jgi:hypothetical protein
MGWSLPYTLGLHCRWKMAPVYRQAVNFAIHGLAGTSITDLAARSTTTPARSKPRRIGINTG